MLGARRPVVLAALSVIAPLTFWSAALLGALLRGAGYDHFTQAVSELSVGDNAAVMDAGFIAYGVLTVAFALGLRRGAPTATSAGFILLAGAGAATAGLGLQWVGWALTLGPPLATPADARGLTVDATYNVVHNALAGSAYVLGAFGAFAVGIGVRPDARWLRYVEYFLVTGPIVLAIALYIQVAVPVLDGLLQRTLILLLQLWPAVYAVRSAGRAPSMTEAMSVS